MSGAGQPLRRYFNHVVAEHLAERTMHASSSFELRQPTLFDRLRSRLLFRANFAGRNLIPAPNPEQAAAVETLRREGSLVLPDYLSPARLTGLQAELEQALHELRFELPCLAQSRIDPGRHAELIANFMYGSPEQLKAWGVTFDRNEARSYEQVLHDFNPSTLSLQMLEYSAAFRSIWLDTGLLTIIANYLGMIPNLAEAYVRRNFPAPHRTMNHYWHRDLNSQHLVKAFFFLSDCAVDNGPHEYVRGSHRDLAVLNGKRYFDDGEVDGVHPPGSGTRFLSIVKAGTVVLEDTRGLHRANLPAAGHRDLGFAVFMPLRPFYPHRNYRFPRVALNELSGFQRAFIPPVMLTT